MVRSSGTENPGGWGGGGQTGKTLRGGGGGMDIFWNHTFQKKSRGPEHDYQRQITDTPFPISFLGEGAAVHRSVIHRKDEARLKYYVK